MDTVTLFVYIKDWKLCDAVLPLDDPVESLAEIVRSRVSRPFKLIYMGKILEEQLTLHHYKIQNNSKIFLYSPRSKPTRQPSPREILLDIFQCTRRLDSCSYDEYCKRMARIDQCINDEQIRQLVAVDPWAEKVLHQVVDFAENCTRQLSESEMRTVCQIEDNWLLQIDNSPGGLRMLQEALEETEVRTTRQFPTVLPNSKPENVPDTALPVCWRLMLPQRTEYDIRTGIPKSPTTFAPRTTCNT